MPAQATAPAWPGRPGGSQGGSQYAGLRGALLRDWQTDFPIEASPFQRVAGRCGCTLREALQHCQHLVAEGATAGLQVRWAAQLHRCGVRLTAAGSVAPALQALAAPGATGVLPALASWHRVDSLQATHPTSAPAPHLDGWFDLHATDPGRLQAQLALLRQATPGVAWTETPLYPADVHLADGAATCDCPAGDGPCSDPALAALCEQGLPVVAHPYRALATRLGRTERAVVLSLKQWRQSGRLAGLGLVPPQAGGDGPAIFAALDGPGPWAGPAAAQACHSWLAAQPGVIGISCTAAPVSTPAAGGWPWPWLVQLAARDGSVPARLARALVGNGLGLQLRAVLQVRQQRVRAAPLLFAPGTAAVC